MFINIRYKILILDLPVGREAHTHTFTERETDGGVKETQGES